MGWAIGTLLPNAALMGVQGLFPSSLTVATTAAAVLESVIAGLGRMRLRYCKRAANTDLNPLSAITAASRDTVWGQLPGLSTNHFFMATLHVYS